MMAMTEGTTFRRAQDTEILDNQGLTSNLRFEEAKKKREERKLLRQKELEARKATRPTNTSGPMKLGFKKM